MSASEKKNGNNSACSWKIIILAYSIHEKKTSFCKISFSLRPDVTIMKIHNSSFHENYSEMGRQKTIFPCTLCGPVSEPWDFFSLHSQNWPRSMQKEWLREENFFVLSQNAQYIFHKMYKIHQSTIKNGGEISVRHKVKQNHNVTMGRILRLKHVKLVYMVVFFSHKARKSEKNERKRSDYWLWF